MKESLSQSYQAGQSARENGRECNSPKYGLGQEWQKYRDEWVRGWKAEDSKHTKSEAKKARK